MSKNRYWTTLSEFDHDPEVEKLRGEEFLAKPEEYFQALKKGGLQFGRRDFLKWSTGALALATTACTRKPAEKIIPYAQQPPELIPGVANYYASTCRECSAGCGILLRTREGRPVKVEGNPLHPVNRGGVCARGQSALLNLYDPDRLRTPVQLQRDPPSTAPLTKIKGEGEDNNYFPPNIWDTGEDRGLRMTINVPLKELGWDEADKQIAARLKPGAKVVLLTGTIHGPARTQLLSDFAAATGAHHVTYDGLNPDALVAAQQASYGTPVVPRFFFDKAEMIVTFGADPLGSGISKVEYLRGYGELRKLRTVDGKAQMSRLVSFEPAMTMTGMNADSRYLVQPQFLLPVALGVAHQIVVVNKQSKFAGNAQVAHALAAFTPDAVETAAGLEKGTIAQVATALWKNRGQGLIWATGVPGATETQEQLEIVAAFLNAALENEGVTVDGSGSVSQQAQGSNAAMLSLVQAMRNKAVDVLIVYGTNPAFTLPAGAGFREALANVPYVVTISDRLDETALLSNVALPALHGMESWGDAEPQKGIYGLVQPTIDPLFNGRSFEDSLMSITRAADPKRFMTTPAAASKPAAGAPPAPAEAPKPLSFYDYLRQHWQNEIYAKNNVAGSFDDFWTGALRQGFFDPNAQQRLKPGSPRSFNAAALAGLPGSLDNSAASGDSFTLVLTVDPMIGDGAHNNNAFLLEIPDPVSKIDWDNYLSIAPKSAKRLGLQEGDLVEITVGDATVKAPLHLQPAVHPGVVTLGLGWGRRAAGQVGAGIGVDAFPLTQITKAGLVYSGASVQLKKVGSGYQLVSPQGNNYINYSHDWVTPEKEHRGEEIIHETTLVQIQSNPRAGNEAALERGNSADMWYLWDGKHNFPRHHWGMTVDLNSCTGCNACVAACYAENNIPVVGKDQVWRGRSMEWIRIDRYFADDTENPVVTNQPMLCQQCGNAGCESVCPVLATVTNDEGLNVQVYNRCVGTRFCSNNCVYKARRFNFYEYSRVRSSPLELALNPDVTVRSMGVMEKCTFCVQRINAGEKRAQALGVPVKDGDIKTACQQTCPSQAIYFGDMNDEKSAMMQARTERSYRALEFLNFRPSVSYLTKIRNVEEQA